eukprot:scaffold21255_cov33-Tisochrysis_lutea.AAC.3
MHSAATENRHTPISSRKFSTEQLSEIRATSVMWCLMHQRTAADWIGGSSQPTRLERPLIHAIWADRWLLSATCLSVVEEP